MIQMRMRRRSRHQDVVTTNQGVGTNANIGAPTMMLTLRLLSTENIMIQITVTASLSLMISTIRMPVLQGSVQSMPSESLYTMLSPTTKGQRIGQMSTASLSTYILTPNPGRKASSSA
jgi:hypothetical protein